MNKSIFLTFAVLSVVAVTIQAATITKREAKPEERPETPLLLECEEAGENRENCFLQDPTNVEIWTGFLEEVQAWEKKDPKAADEFNGKNPNLKKEEKDKLAELEKFAAVHE